MRRPRTLALLCIATALAFGAAAGTAHAITVSPGGSVTARSSGNITFTSSLSSISCPVTLSGEEYARITPREGETLGVVARATIGGCTGGTVEATGLPWTVTYERSDLTGTPKLIYRKTKNVTFNATVGGVNCGYQGDVPQRLPAIDGPTRYNAIQLLGNILNKISGGIFCPSSGSLSGSYSTTEELWILP